MHTMHRLGLTPPTPFLQNTVKDSPGRGWGTHRPATVLSHIVGSLCLLFPPSRRGKCCSFFSFCVFGVWSSVFCRFFCRSSRLRVVFLKKFSGANFCFRVLVLVLCFLVGFCLCFCFIFWRFAPETVWKNSIDVRSGFFWVRSLFLWFFRRRRRRFEFLFLLFSFSRDKVQVVTGHPRTRTCFLVLSLFCVPPLLSVPPVLAVRPASWRFSGVPFWAPGVFGILLGLSEAFSWDARRQGSSCVALVLFFFSPFVLRPHLF